MSWPAQLKPEARQRLEKGNRAARPSSCRDTTCRAHCHAASPGQDGRAGKHLPTMLLLGRQESPCCPLWGSHPPQQGLKPAPGWLCPLPHHGPPHNDFQVQFSQPGAAAGSDPPLGPQLPPGTHWPHSAPSIRPPPRRDKEAFSLPAPRHPGAIGTGSSRSWSRLEFAVLGWGGGGESATTGGVPARAGRRRARAWCPEAHAAAGNLCTAGRRVHEALLGAPGAGRGGGGKEKAEGVQGGGRGAAGRGACSEKNPAAALGGCKEGESTLPGHL